jgi:hypothetical protein
MSTRKACYPGSLRKRWPVKKYTQEWEANSKVIKELACENATSSVAAPLSLTPCIKFHREVIYLALANYHSS